MSYSPIVCMYCIRPFVFKYGVICFQVVRNGPYAILVISGIKEDESGLYECQVIESSTGNAFKTQIELLVEGLWLIKQVMLMRYWPLHV